MEKHLIRWTYWLGLACVVVALAWRALNTMGAFLPDSMVLGRSIYYMSFYKAALILLVTSMATASYAASQKS